MIKNFIYKSVHIIFSLLAVMILISTLFIDKSINYTATNSVNYPNSLYFLVSILVLTGLFALGKLVTSKGDINRYVYIASMVAVPLIFLLCFQYPIAYWFGWLENPVYDWGSVFQGAMKLSNGETLKGVHYFVVSTNNVNMTVFLSWIYKLIPDWRFIIFLGAMLTNASVVFSALAIKNLTNSRYCSLVLLILGEILFSLNWRTYIVYTDNFGSIFVAIALWIITLKFKDRYKFPLLFLVAGMGALIKPTIGILIFAYLIYWFVELVFSDKPVKGKLIRSLICVAGVVLFLLVFSNIQSGIRKTYEVDSAHDYPKGWQYMLLVGQNTDGYGLANNQDVRIRNFYVNEAETTGKDVSYLNEKFLEFALGRIERRGFVNNVTFYLEKLTYAYSDGSFTNSSLKPIFVNEEVNIDRDNELYDYYSIVDGKNAGVLGTIFQIIWDVLLILLIAGTMAFNSNDEIKFLEILIIGITIYLLLFECRAKYLFMFVPVYIVIAGYALNRLKEKIANMR